MPYLIAEIGFNHGGDVALATTMIEAAADAGADAVKFQSFTADDLYFPDHEAYAVFAAGQLSEEDHRRLKRVADGRGIDFLSTPLGIGWVAFLDRLGVPGFKIASMDVVNPVLLEAVGGCGKRVYLSTGGATVDEMKTGVATLIGAGAASVSVLHCVSNYPTRPDEAALATIPLLRSLFGDDVGFSDHTLGVAIPTAAAALGAQVIEKHFTVDKSLPGPDNAMAADPAEFAAMAAAVREVAEAVAPVASLEIGLRPDGAKRSVMRRSAYAAVPIAVGEIITLDHLRLVRPEGAPLGETLALRLGKPAVKGYGIGEPI